MDLLTELPTIALDLILKNVDWKDIISLRKVNFTIRNYMEDVVPTANLTSISITVASDNISCEFSDTKVEYRKHLDGCLVVCSKIPLILRNLDFVTACRADLAVIFRHSRIEELNLYFTYFTDEMFSVKDENLDPIIDRFLWNFNDIKVTTLHIESLGAEHVLRILPHLEPKTLETLRIWYQKYHYRRREEIPGFETDEIVELDQWKQAKTLSLRPYRLNCGLMHFGHVSGGFIYVDRNFIKNPEFDYFHIEYDQFDNYNELLSVFGPSDDRDDLQRAEWYYNDRKFRFVIENFNDISFHMVSR
uniref:F-box domain-containing protein n=1 Tax=Caenorhabditis tropicalis TaxID=1561998 RepID=A0A1I7TD47_9PELO